jgi:WD40 repeat protein
VLTVWHNVGLGDYGLSTFQVDVSHDGTLLVSSNTSAQDQPRTLNIWRLADEEIIHTIPGELGTFNPQEPLLAGIDTDGLLTLWDAHTASVQTSFARPQREITDLVWHPDGQQIATMSGSGTVLIWHRNQREPVLTLEPPDAFRGTGAAGEALSFNADGSILAVGTGGVDVQLWHMPDGRPLHTLKGSEYMTTDLAFSPDSSLLAVARSGTTEDYRVVGDVQLWRVTDGVLLQTLPRSSDEVAAVAFSPDGTTLVSAEGIYTINVWRP